MSEARCSRRPSGLGDPFGCTVLEDRLPDEEALSASRASLDRPGALARLIEGEILPRLMLVHAEPPPPRAVRRPGPDEIARFANLLLAPRTGGDATGDDLRPAVETLRARGLPLESLLGDLLAPAARHLGALWEEDACDFLAVTVGLGRLQAVARMLCARLEGEPPPRGRSALLLPCPGETHVFGLTLVASAFREAGWTVETAEASEGATTLARDFHDVVGLTLACDVNAPSLAAAIATLRAASCNRELRVLVGGAYVARYPERAVAAGADACLCEAAAAPAVAESLLEMRARAC
ncbi:cobalamin B12-binding domain-containing protein [Methylobacterium radiodurans]|uniref:Cobalamin-binding protein n=1 Tax=Methylobacterium radiodurans TaxID=2202828 RepID=A0A2U8VWA0_9HYPH|nr:cobalamin-dependent protein [Methylobacterium radiodurans]AWN37386.1 cobalamin-binding protein [Methylobacterium radiodurans]